VDAFVFIFGFVVTVVVVGAVGTIWWAAIGDGQRNEQAKGEREDHERERRGLRRVA
jgi:hypothetical protein